MSPIAVVAIAAATLVVGLLIGYIYRKNVGEKTIGSAEQKAKNLILDAETKSETIKKEITLEAKEEAHRMRSEAEREVRERRNEIADLSRRRSQSTGSWRTSKKERKVFPVPKRK